MVWRVERENRNGSWAEMMYGQHRLNITDVRGPLTGGYIGGGDIHAAEPTPGNKTVFSGDPGLRARVRYNDTVTEIFRWEQVPVNERDPDSDWMWGWKLIETNYVSVPFEELWPRQG